MQFNQPDTLIPDTYNTLDWNRYSYARYNPLRYTDPTGHMVDDGRKSEGFDKWNPKSNADNRNWAFTIMFKGSGKDDAWTRDDWNYYLDHQKDLWAGEDPWWNPDDVTGWDLFALHTKRLASQYNADQEEQFVRDFALVFAGMSTTNHWAQAAWNAIDGSTDYPHLIEGNDGLPEQYLDMEGNDVNQSHHYAGIFFAGYFAGGPVGMAGNYGRDTDNPGDIALGAVAALHGARLRDQLLRFSPIDVANWIDELSP